ncbi:LemA family protein [Candidatus Saccharibacteria bacterium]|nr:LemA family protein [Candidatus Saccharibacteria bacterium]
MKKSTSIFLIIAAVVVILAGFLISKYNSMVTMSERVDAKFSDIDTQLQRRADLIPNLVSSVQGYMGHEQAAIEKVAEARTKLMNANTVAEKADADNALSGALANLLALSENYPDLKANTNFITLMDELAGTENRIATSRKDYNDIVKEFNTLIKRFPNSMLAGMFGFGEKEYFKAAEGASEVPKVEFNNTTE